MVNVLGQLREIQTSELEMMLAWRNSPAVRMNMYTRQVITLEEHLSWWNKLKSSSASKYFMYVGAGRPQGVVAFTGIDKGSNNSSWAFYANPEAPKGTGSRMEFLALSYAFDELGLHKLCCEVLAFNAAVIKLHQKFGFTIEGVLREQHFVEDKYVDVIRLGVLAAEWKEHKDELLAKLIRR